jgi:hypothetical protein
MLKLAPFMGALIIALPLTYPANALPREDALTVISCDTPKDISALTMSRIYAVDPHLVGVSVNGARKEMTSSFIITDTTTKIADAECVMKIKTVQDDCTIWVSELECQPVLTPLQRTLVDMKKQQDLAALNDKKVRTALEALGPQQMADTGRDNLTPEGKLKVAKSVAVVGADERAKQDRENLDYLRHLIKERE